MDSHGFTFITSLDLYGFTLFTNIYKDLKFRKTFLEYKNSWFSFAKETKATEMQNMVIFPFVKGTNPRFSGFKIFRKIWFSKKKISKDWFSKKKVFGFFFFDKMGFEQKFLKKLGEADPRFTWIFMDLRIDLHVFR